MAAIVCINPTSTTLTASVTAMTANQSKRIEFYLQTGHVSNPSGGTIKSNQPIGTSTTASYLYTGLSPNTNYTLYVKVYNASTGAQLGFSTYWAFGTTTSPAISPWDWYSSNGDAYAWQTQNAYTAVTNGGQLSDFSYLVWNDLVNKIHEAREAGGQSPSWNTKYATLSATLMSPSDKILTATRFNSARYNIGLVYSTGIDEISTGDKVYGWYFTRLANSLNSYINSL